MRKLNAKQLMPLDAIPNALMHRSGTVLLKPGEKMSEKIIAALASSNQEPFYLLTAGERTDEARRSLTNKQVQIEDLNEGEPIPATLYDNAGKLLLEEGASIPKNFVDSLARRNITSIFFRKSPKELFSKEGRELRATIENIVSGKVIVPVAPVAEPVVIEKIQNIKLETAAVEDLDVEQIEKKIETLESLEVLPTGEAWSKEITDTRKLGPAPAEVKAAFSSVVQSDLKMVRKVFDDIKRGERRISVEVLDNVVTNAMAGTIRNRELLILFGTADNSEEYLVSHALAMMVLAVNVGASMKFSVKQVKELAYGALLADIGMLKIPRELAEKETKLTPREHAEIRRHPAYGLDMLQRVSSIPEMVPYVVYQSHERANGSGYPCGKKDVIIHTFAKIVSVVDIYASVCSTRPYRKQRTPYEAMEEVVLACGKRLLNADVTKAFLRCNSMFPIGSYIRLSNGAGARVVAANPEDYMRPLVALLCDPANVPIPDPPRLDLLEQEELSVAQAVFQSELPVAKDLMLGF